MKIMRHLLLLFLGLITNLMLGQANTRSYQGDLRFEKAYQLAYEGDHTNATGALLEIVANDPQDQGSRTLLARTYSWTAQYDTARAEFNKILSAEKSNVDIWIAAIKNELYAGNNATALGLANKALAYVNPSTEIDRLRALAFDAAENQKYTGTPWSSVESGNAIKSKVAKKATENIWPETPSNQALPEKKEVEAASATVPSIEKALNNQFSIRNSYTVFDQRYDPMAFSSIEFKRQTLAGSIIPRINYGNRSGSQGVQYDLDFYPKFSKRFYAYLNYGYSNASIYPNHKLGGDLYVNLPGAIEFSAGGRFVALDDRSVTVITNSLGHYRGNYYFSLRSNFTPTNNNLNQFSGNLLVRKYLKDAFNFWGINIGMGYSPELRQLISGDELLAETLLYIESQRMSVQYQFSGKKNPNVYSASLGVTRQELSFDPGRFIWAVSAGLAYQVRF